jgi:hypothetical protein
MPRGCNVRAWIVSMAGLPLQQQPGRARPHALQDGVASPHGSPLPRTYLPAAPPRPLAAAIYDADFIAANQEERADNLIKGTKREQLETLRGQIRAFKESNAVDRVVVLWTANTERYAQVGGAAALGACGGHAGRAWARAHMRAHTHTHAHCWCGGCICRSVLTPAPREPRCATAAPLPRLASPSRPLASEPAARALPTAAVCIPMTRVAFQPPQPASLRPHGFVRTVPRAARTHWWWWA